MATYQNLESLVGLKIGDIVEYTYSGEVVSVVAGKGTYKLTVSGGQGGYINSSANGGSGGSAEGIWANKTNGRIMYIRVGSSGNNGGFNGGGERTTIDDYPGGGGASDIRLDTDSLYHRLIVGGGGGSESRKNTVYNAGGVGGGVDGGNKGYTPTTATYGGMGGTQIAGGSAGTSPNNGATKGEFGVGGNGGWYSNQTLYNDGAGGGGWYGGGGAYRASTTTTYAYGGGGGSGFAWANQALTLPDGGVWGLSYKDALTDVLLTQGGNSGDGVVTIQVVGLPPIYLLATDDTDTYGYVDDEWEVVIPGEIEPSSQDFVDYGVTEIQTFDGLPENSTLLTFDVDQRSNDYALVVTSNPPDQVVTMKSGIALPFGTTAEEPTITVATDGGGTAVMTDWKQTGNKVKVEITMSKPDRNATASVSEIKAPFSKGS